MPAPKPTKTTRVPNKWQVQISEQKKQIESQNAELLESAGALEKMKISSTIANDMITDMKDKLESLREECIGYQTENARLQSENEIRTSALVAVRAELDDLRVSHRTLQEQYALNRDSFAEQIDSYIQTVNTLSTIADVTVIREEPLEAPLDEGSGPLATEPTRIDPAPRKKRRYTPRRLSRIVEETRVCDSTLSAK